MYTTEGRSERAKEVLSCGVWSISSHNKDYTVNRGHCHLHMHMHRLCTSPTWRLSPSRQGEGDSQMTRSWADHWRDDQEGTSGVVADQRVVVHSARMTIGQQ